MPDTNGIQGVPRLPIRLVMPRQGTERRVPGGGSRREPFRQVDEDYRGRLWREVTHISSALASQLGRLGAAPVRVKLLSRAAAKSHRPEHLFSSSTCPIVGAGALGELFIRATSGGLENLATAIRDAQGDRMVQELSCVETIEPVSPAYRRHGLNSSDILRRSPRSSGGFTARVRLFDFGAYNMSGISLSGITSGILTGLLCKSATA